MMRAVLILLSLLLSSCSFYTDITSAVKGNPFEVTYSINDHDLSSVEDIFAAEVPPEPGEGDEGGGEDTGGPVPPPPEALSAVEPSRFTFALVTDPHIGRGDSGVTQHTEEFIDFLRSTEDIQFVACLGDIPDNGDIYSKDVEAFINDSRKATATGNFIYVLGNHDKRTHSEAEWDERFSVLTPDYPNPTPRMMRYSFNGVSIYKLDNSSRIFGKEQLSMLEEALRNDPNRYRIFLAHETVATGGELDQSLVVFGSEAGELLRLFRIMDEYNVSILFTGHHHKGNAVYEGRSFVEFNAAALHERSVFYESDGYWYTVDIDPVEESIVITAYSITDDAARPWRETASYTFPLVAAS